MKYNYEFFGSFKLSNGGTRSNESLGTTVVEENEIPSSGDQRKNYLIGVAHSNFGGKIAQVGTLTDVHITKKGRADDSSKNESKDESKGGGIGKWLLKQALKPYKK